MIEFARIPGPLLYPALGAAGFGVFALVANRQVFHPMRYPGGWWEHQAEIGATDVEFDTPDGLRLHGWWSPVEGASFVHLFLHGNAGNVSHRGPHIRAVNAAGASILVVDYRGYGKSEGRPSEAGLYTDAEAAYQYLRDLDFLPEQIIIHGESLGTSVSVELANRVEAAGLILEAPFTSAGDVAHGVVPYLGPLVVRGFRTEKKIGFVKAPLWIIHGEQDELINIKMGRALFESAPEPKSFWKIPGAGHNDIIQVAGLEYTHQLRRYHAGIR